MVGMTGLSGGVGGDFERSDTQDATEVCLWDAAMTVAGLTWEGTTVLRAEGALAVGAGFSDLGDDLSLPVGTFLTLMLSLGAIEQGGLGATVFAVVTCVLAFPTDVVGPAGTTVLGATVVCAFLLATTVAAFVGRERVTTLGGEPVGGDVVTL